MSRYTLFNYDYNAELDDFFRNGEYYFPHIRIFKTLLSIFLNIIKNAGQ